jgi:hypothetical protein
MSIALPRPLGEGRAEGDRESFGGRACLSDRSGLDAHDWGTVNKFAAQVDNADLEFLTDVMDEFAAV